MQYIFCSNSFTCKCSLHSISWSRSSPLVFGTPSLLDPHQMSSRISCCCLESWRSCSYVLQGQSLQHSPAGHRWGVDVEESQFKALKVCLGSSWVILLRLLGPPHSREGWNMFSHTCGEGWIQLSQVCGQLFYEGYG